MFATIPGTTIAREKALQRYNNLSGESGVLAYAIGDRAIIVRFTGGERYLYTDQSAGADNIAEMQPLATFISQVVKERYARKLDQDAFLFTDKTDFVTTTTLPERAFAAVLDYADLRAQTGPEGRLTINRGGRRAD